ncbi:MAG: helix-hairpin-helix domain-containing protein [Marinobacter sp.]|uniref:ComEA family DNA-binding protein n=1 Tax=Marinobacter sp. TaxID=50741 RepID=UPI00299DB234|nr:helix-hairpin-helix domain-containing protein [Marinobacter sp.]MDX1757909.1 helix-hairpin-helix domain-containing protein [Marinobacter sp.]
MNRNPFLAALLFTLCLFTGIAHAEPAADAQPVNINTATAAELSSLDGIGESKAQAIVAYRESHGPFQSPAELTNVRGIGDQTLSQNAPRITLE